MLTSRFSRRTKPLSDSTELYSADKNESRRCKLCRPRRRAAFIFALLVSTFSICLFMRPTGPDFRDLERCSSDVVKSAIVTQPTLLNGLPPRILYVDPSIQTAATSSFASAGEHFGSLTAALESVTEQRQTSSADHPQAVIRLLPGIHQMLDQTDVAQLTSIHSGEQGASTIIEGWDTDHNDPQNSVIVQGGVSIPLHCIRPVTQMSSDKFGSHRTVASSLSHHIRVVDLNECFEPSVVKSIVEPAVASGFGMSVMPVAAQLYQGLHAYQTARWPNQGWLFTKAPIRQQTPQKYHPFSFGIEDEARDRVNQWHASQWCRGGPCDSDALWTPNNLWISGFFSYDWADLTARVGSIHLVKGIVTSAEPSLMPIQAEGTRFVFLNVLDELDVPGEYVIDRANQLLLFYPLSSSLDSLVISVLDTPFITMDRAHHVAVRSLTLTLSRASALRVIGDSSSVILQKLSVHRIGNVGVIFGTGARYKADRENSAVVGSLQWAFGDTMLNRHCGTNNRVEFSLFDLIGAAGIMMCGGDRRTLAAGHNVVQQNVMTRTGQVWMTYMPAISLDGVGNEASNNRISLTPHASIIVHGNNHMILRNDISLACVHSADCGAMYMGRDWTQRGNVFQHNFIHHLVSSVSLSDLERRARVKRDDRSFCGNESNSDTAECFEPLGVDIRAIYMDDCASGNNITHNIFYHVPHGVFIGGGREHFIQHNSFIHVQTPIQIDARGVKTHSYTTTHSLFVDYNKVPVTSSPWMTAYPTLAQLLQDDPFVPKRVFVSDNTMIGCGQDRLTTGLLDHIDTASERRLPDKAGGQAVVVWDDFVQTSWERHGLEYQQQVESVRESDPCTVTGQCLNARPSFALSQLGDQVKLPEGSLQHPNNGPCSLQID